MQIDVTPTAPADWDAYVESHPAASAYHRAAAVDIGAQAFGLRTSFLTARAVDGRIAGLLPLVEQSSLLFGRFLVSVPFFTYGGTLAQDGGVALALARRAAELGRQRRASHVELRHAAPLEALGLPERLDKVSMILPLPQSEEALAQQIGRKMRWQIRRADGANPQIVSGGAELLPEFYNVFAVGMHNLGTPVYPRVFFEVVCRALQGFVSVVVVRLDGTAHAAAILVRHGPRTEVPWAITTPAGREASVNKRMYWEMLRIAMQSGAEAFDFGRSSVGSGTYQFKLQWGAKPRQLHWHYWLSSGNKLPRLNYGNPKYAMAAAVWRRMPLWCANILGPRLARHLP
jgi:FemAB-related protein (PEP-CTERM system-associated)